MILLVVDAGEQMTHAMAGLMLQLPRCRPDLRIEVVLSSEVTLGGMSAEALEACLAAND